jgi:hypothetical protein
MMNQQACGCDRAVETSRPQRMRRRELEIRGASGRASLLYWLALVLILFSPTVAHSQGWSPTAIPPGYHYSLIRSAHSAVWTGSEMIIWGGSWGTHGRNNGLRYDPATNSWTPTSTADAPPASSGHTAIWTGEPLNMMIVFGGGAAHGPVFGGMYEPAKDKWTPIIKDKDHPQPNMPNTRLDHSAVWTGKEMIIWGGFCTGTCMRNDGARFDPETKTWRAMATPGAFLPGRRGHIAVWTGTEMIIWGGKRTVAVLRNGARYNPENDTWTPMSLEGAPARDSCTGVWSGKELLVWGGYNFHRDGYRYDPAADQWTPMTLVGAPPGRGGHTAVWTGSEMIVWGGMNGGNGWRTNTGGRYEPETDQWLPLPMENVPGPRIGHTAVWTGTEMIVWGGTLNQSIYGATDTGGRYMPGCGVILQQPVTRQQAGPSCPTRCAVKLIEPTPGARYDREIPIKLQPVPPDAYLQSIEVLVDGVVKDTRPAHPQDLDFKFDSSQLIGKHTIQVKAYDVEGHACPSPVVPVNVGATVKVLILIFDPLFENPGGPPSTPSNVFFHTLLDYYQDPLTLTAGYIDALRQASGGFADYKVVKSLPAFDGLPKQVNGHVLTDNEYFNRLSKPNFGWAKLAGVVPGQSTKEEERSLGDDPERMRYAQSFRVWGAGLKGIMLKLSKVGSPQQPIRVSVRPELDAPDLCTQGGWCGATIKPDDVTATPADVEVKGDEFELRLEDKVTYYLTVQVGGDSSAAPDPSNYYKLGVVRTTTPRGLPPYTDPQAELFQVSESQQTPLQELDMSLQLNFSDRTDYNYILDEQVFPGADRTIAQYVRDGLVDEVFTFEGPPKSMWEAAMMGHGAYYVNGDAWPEINSDRAFVVMGFNYEREVPEMVHDFGHRTEGIMTHVYGEWSNNPYWRDKAEPLPINTNWDRFTAFKGVLPVGQDAACGSVHFTPNATNLKDYSTDPDWSLISRVRSTCDDWLTYPNFKGVKQVITASAWKGTQLGFLNWWLKHLPKADGCNPDERLNNWWRYVVEPDYYKNDSRCHQ